MYRQKSLCGERRKRSIRHSRWIPIDAFQLHYLFTYIHNIYTTSIGDQTFSKCCFIHLETFCFAVCVHVRQWSVTVFALSSPEADL